MRRSTRERFPIDQLDPSLMTAGKVYMKEELVEETTIAFDGDTVERSHNLYPGLERETSEDVEYAFSHATLIARVMKELSEGANVDAKSFAQMYVMQKGAKMFGQPGSDAAGKELEQLHQRNCFTPISIAELSAEEKKKAMRSLMFLTEKKDGTIKGRMVYDGKPTREWLTREDSASPTAALESILLTL